jgi:transketolase
MAWLSKANIKFIGSHAGVSIGEDGSSQMGLEEIGMFGMLPGTIVLQPSDAVSTVKLLQSISQTEGIVYIQTLRPKTPILYEKTEEFPIPGSKIVKRSDTDVLTIIGTGITVHEAIKAYELLRKEEIRVRVIDCYSLSPIDKETLIHAANETQLKILITVEDHFMHGGLGDFVNQAVSGTGIRVHKMAVAKRSHSGTKDELLDDAGISSVKIIAAVKSFLK